MNLVVLHGQLSRPPVRRTLPSGDELVAYEVTVAREGERAESVPVVWPGAPASATDVWVEGQAVEVVVAGRVRRRFYRAGGVTQSRTEVVADAVVPAHHARRRARLVANAAAALDVALGR